ncbi:hypothetical protein RBSWK_02190 [Rhodopirellula baltica SWK14]|uniref:Uncharacterized protein n=1 Tax=Rhodopirellula baltica SWK14 TaxID=993516 RepID=L7CII7_RHOBT|nr:hypothetical protein RBSWK_02190 [Rhodopirellula baltica SWK14]
MTIQPIRVSICSRSNRHPVHAFCSCRRVMEVLEICIPAAQTP